MLTSILLTTLLNKVIVCFEDSNESRYIDLLPEEEKEQFLERIARRILEDGNVKDGNNNKHSIEITEHQLNEHNDFVQNILQEESENLRKNKINGKNEDENIENGKNEIIKPDKVEHDVEDSKVVDLHMKKNKRNSFDNVNADNYTYINVAVKYDNEHLEKENKDTEILLPLTDKENNKIHVRKTEKSVDNEAERSDIEDIQVKNIGKHFIKEDGDSEKFEVIKNDKDADVINNVEVTEHITEEIATSKQYQNTTHDGNFQQTTDNLPTELTTVNTETETIPDNDSEFTKKINNSHISKATTADNIPTYTATTEVTESSNLATVKISNNGSKFINGSVILTSGLDYKETNSHSKDKHMLKNSKKNVIKYEDLSITKIQLTSKNSFTEKSMTTDNGNKNINVSNKTRQPRDDVQNVKPLLFSETKRISTVSARTNKRELENEFNKENLDFIKTDDSKDDITQDFLKALRINLLNNDKPSDKNGIDTSKRVNNERNFEYSPKRKLNEYHVYEIFADKPVFNVQSKVKHLRNDEQPYYIPIYNYSPNNAYFNAQNRYGPNFDDTALERDSIDFTDRENVSNERSSKYSEQRKFNFVKRPGRNTKLANIKKAYFDRIVQIKSTRDPSVKLYVPEDYIKSDYNFGKTNDQYLRAVDKSTQELPASDEDTHPFSSLNKVKSHIRAIRHILFEQKRFGYVKKVNSSELKSAENENHTGVGTTTHLPYLKLKRERTKTDSSGKNSISLDYYLSRLKLDSSSNEYIDRLGKKLGYIRYSDGTKYLYLPSNVFKSNRYKMKASNNVPYFKEAKIDNRVNKNVKIYSSSHKPMNQSELFYDPSKAIMDVTSKKYFIQTVKKLKALNNISNKLDAYVEVMKDMVNKNSKALKQYDWLGTTVDIQAAIKKLQDLIESLRNNENIHPSDLQLLKYVIYLYAESKMLQSEISMGKSKYELRNKLLPKIKKRRKNFLKIKGLLNRVWLLRHEAFINSNTGELFNDFLYNLQNALFDVHEAIKNIASVTNVRNQRWFENIKELYLTGDRRQLLSIILHLSATRLFSMIEENSADIEANLEAFLNEKEDVVRETINEFKFILIVLKEIMTLH